MAATNEISEVCNLERFSVRDLRDYLRERGEKISGNRPELIKRAKGVYKLGKRRRSEIEIEDTKAALQRECEKFTTPLNEKLPKPWTIDNWESDVDRIPFLRSGDLYNYLVLNRNRTFDSNSVNAKRQLKAKVFYEDKHVHSVMYHEITKDCSHCYVRCNVIPSMPSSNASQNPDYITWVCLAKMSGNVHSAGCTCSAGEGESCNHIAALLYAIVDISNKRQDGLHAPTSRKCLWNQPRKRKLSPKKAHHLVFKKHKFDKDSSSKDPMFRETYTPSPKIQRTNIAANILPLDASRFREKLKLTAPHSAFLLSDSKNKKSADKNVLGCDNSDLDNMHTLHKISFAYHDKVDLKKETCVNHFKDYFNQLSCSREECTVIEKETRGQSENKLWSKYRVGRVTSSNFGRICKLKSTTPVDNVVKNIMNYNCDFTSKSTEWGKKHENAAKRVYCKNILNQHPNLTSEKCGVIIDPNLPHLGSSPDALLQCTCSKCENQCGVLEIKCPYAWRFVSPVEASKDKTFFCELTDNKPRLKRNHSYFYQVQGQMAISHRKWCDFFVWTLRGFSIERIYFDPVFWSSMLEKINNFYISSVIPELWSERVKRGLPLFDH